MDRLRLPPVTEEVLDPSGDLRELKMEKSTEPLRAKETEGDAEKGQQEETEEEEKQDEDEDEDESSSRDEDQGLEQLKAQTLHLLHQLKESRDDRQRREESFLQLQGVLEEERLTSAHQAQSFSRHIQRLQAQLHSLQEEMSVLEEEKDGELEEVQQELCAVQVEMLELRQAAEEAVAERENDIATLQEELSRLEAELRCLHVTAQEYELEVTTLGGQICPKSRNIGEDAGGLEAELLSLTGQRHSLSDNSKQLSSSVQPMQRQQGAREDVEPAVRSERVTSDAYITLSRASPELLEQPPEDPDPSSDQDAAELNVLKVQLQQAEETAQEVQRQCDGLGEELVELQRRYVCSRRERAALEEELHRCRARLQELLGAEAQVATFDLEAVVDEVLVDFLSPAQSPRPSEPGVLSIPVLGTVVAAAVIWCWWEELASQS